MAQVGPSIDLQGKWNMTQWLCGSGEALPVGMEQK